MRLKHRNYRILMHSLFIIGAVLFCTTLGAHSSFAEGARGTANFTSPPNISADPTGRRSAYNILTRTPRGGTPGEIAPDACDPQYWKTLEARAWLEAEREIIQNQNLILKADSVLEYSCFHSYVAHNANHAGSIFVHTQYETLAGPPEATDPNFSMVGALKKVVFDSYKTYIENNFSGTYLDSRVPGGGRVAFNFAAGNYNCSQMNQVWETAKCFNFTEEDRDGFKPIRTITNIDGTYVRGYTDLFTSGYDRTRQKGLEDGARGESIGQYCEAPRSEWDNYKSIVYDDIIYPFPKASDAVTDYTIIRDLTSPGNCSAKAPILTGVLTILSPAANLGPLEDGFCINNCIYSADPVGDSPGGYVPPRCVDP